MTLLDICKKLFCRTTVRKSLVSTRLGIEHLEDRVVPATITFTNAAGGPWSTPTNWDLNRAPIAGDDVVIPNFPGNQTITFSTGTTVINSLSVSENLTLTGGNLSVTSTAQVTSGTVTLSGGTLSNTTLTSATPVVLTSSGGTLTGITLNGDLDLTSGSAFANISNGLSLNGTATLGDRGRLYFNGTQTLGGTGTVVFQNVYGNGLVPSSNGMTLTISSGITVRGGSTQGSSATIGYSTQWGGGSNTSLVLQGTISADTAGMGITLSPVGTGTLTNTGNISVSTGTVNLGGNMSLASLGTITRTGGTVNLLGVLDNTGTTLALNATTGSWNLLGGTIKNGTVSLSGATKLFLTSSGGTLDGLVVNGDLDLTSGSAFAIVSNGLTLNGTATLGDRGRFYFNGTQTLGGTGTVVFQNVYGNGLVSNTSGMTLTIGSGITVRGGSSQGNSATIGYSGQWGGGGIASLVLQGTIAADTTGMGITLAPINSGTLTNTGNIIVSAGTVNLGGNMTLATLGTITRTGGTVNLNGVLDLQGNTWNLNATTGSWNLVGGTIKNGTVTLSDGVKLFLTSSGGTLDGITVNGDLDLTSGSAFANVSNGLTLNGTATLGDRGRFYFNGTQTLGGTGTVVFQNVYGNGLVSSTGGMTLTIGSGITVRGGSSQGFSATIGYSGQWGGGGNASLVLQGTIAADIVGTGITLTPNGTGTLTNTGTISITGGAIYLAGNMTLASLGTINRTGGSVSLNGVLDLQGNTWNLNATTGSWNLLGGTVKNGTVTMISGAKLFLTSTGGTLDGITVNGDLDLTSGSAFANVTNGLTLNGTATLGDRGRFYFNGTQTLGGTGTVVFQNFYGNGLVSNTGGMTLTIGSGITVRGGSSQGFSATIGYSSQWGGGGNTSLVLQGTIAADTVGTGITLTPNGTGILTNTGTISVTGGAIYLAGNMTPASLGTITRTGGSVNLNGVLDLQGNTWNLNATTGSWNLIGGTIKNGTVSLSGGAKLVLTNSGGTLDGLVVNGDLDLTSGSSYANVSNGLTLNGTATLGFDGRLLFNGTQTLGGNGTVVFLNAASNSAPAMITNTSGMTLTIGAGVTIRGGGSSSYGGVIGANSYWGGGANTSIILHGMVKSDLPGSGGLSLQVHGTGTLTNNGTITASQTPVTISGGAWTNNGTITVSSGTVTLGGSFNLATLGNFSAASSTVNLTGVLNNTDTTLAFDSNMGTWYLRGGSIIGGVATTMAGGSNLFLTLSGGTLSGLTLNGNLDATSGSAYAAVSNGLTLNGTATLGYDGRLLFNGTQTLGGNATIVYQNAASNSAPALVTNAAGMTLTVAAGVTIRGGGSSGYGGVIGANSYWGGGANTSIILQGVVKADLPGSGGLNVQVNGTGTLTHQGTLSAQNGSTLTVGTSVLISGTAALDEASNSTMVFGGNLLSSTTNPTLFRPQGTVVFNGGGTSAAPRLLEAMGQDLGAVNAGFVTTNFLYGAITLANNTYLKLVDQSDNVTGSAAEAIYTNSLIIPTGSTLDLNGLKVYTRALQQVGSVVNGSIVVIADSGPLTLGTPTPGTINPAGQFDEWTFFARVGKAITVQITPGTVGSPTPLPPPLNWVRVQLYDPNDNLLATATSVTSGQQVRLNDINIPADGTYKLRVSAAPSQSNSTGNYIVTAWDTTATVRSLNLNSPTTGTLATPFALDRWTFSAVAGQQVRFDWISASTQGIGFSFTGPNGFTGFSEISADSPLLTIPTDGTYSVSVHSLVGATGSYTFAMLLTSQTDITLNTPFSSTLVGSGYAQLFRFDVPSPQVLTVSLTDSATIGHTELYARFGSPPTRETFDYSATGPGRTPSLFVPSASPGTWYVLVYGENIPVSGSYTILARGAAARLTSSFPKLAGNAAPALVTLTGAGFAPGTTVALVASNGTTTYAPTSFSIDLYTQITATFPAGLPADTYSIRVTTNSNTDTLTNALTVTAGGQSRLETNLIIPPALGRHALATLYVEFANTGDLAMPAPLLSVQSADPDDSDKPILALDQDRILQNFWSTGLVPGTGNSVLILGSGKQPGVLNPGERVRVPVYYLGLQQPWNFSDTQVELEIRYWTDTDTAPIDWASRQENLRPASLSAEQWNAVYGNLTSSLATTGDYVRMLNQNAAFLGQQGEIITSVDDLWNFEVQQAYGYTAVPTLDSAVDAAMPTPGVSLDFARQYGNSIQSRYATGPLGRGWYNPWQTQVIPATGFAGLTLVGGGTVRVFQKDVRTTSAYFSSTGDSSSFVSIGGGVYELRAVSGIVTRFRADGKIDYVQDTNNNRITASYDTQGRLSKLTHTSGAFLTFAYNTAGLYSSITDSAGRVTTYGYDNTNTYLTTVTTPDGKITRYTYQSSLVVVPAMRNALLSIERGGTTQFFDYDTRGRLNYSYLTGNAQLVTYAYNDTGLVTVSDSAGTTSLYFDYNGLLAKVRDPLGNLTSNEFNSDLRLSKTVSPTGESQSFTWCSCGSMTSVTNELGQTTNFTYDAINGSFFKRMTSFTDANGKKTTYTYDANGNLLTTIYPNNSVERLSSYTAAGLPGVSTNRRGQTLSYTYNAAGQVTKQTFANNTFITFAYDTRGNLTTVTDGTQVTTYTYSFATDGDRLKRITYPNGRYLDYIYDTFGRRTRMTDQDNYQTRYEYDTAGRLYRLRDALDAILVTYTYDASGRLSRVDKGNGTFTTYSYDAAGQLLSLKNWRDANILNSKFDYTYDSRGRRVTMVTLDGTWTYGYDGSGQLTRAVFASLNTTVIPNQDLQYFYDAVGNRTKTILNGVTTIYAANNLNQYTTVGGVGQTYDADGNLTFDGINTYTYDQQSRLISVSGPQGLTQYEYDAFGNRVAKVENGVRTEYLNDTLRLNSVVAEFNNNTSEVSRYVFGLGLAQTVTSGISNYYDFDAVGNTVGLTSNAGVATNRYVLEPFGAMIYSTTTVPNPFIYSGATGVRAEQANRYHMGTREYLAGTGRFLVIDRIGINGGDVNFYRYVSNSPIAFIDPVGLAACPDHISGINLDYWRNYEDAPGYIRSLGAMLFHRGNDVYLEKVKPGGYGGIPQNECEYNRNTGLLVPGGGTPNYYDGDGTRYEKFMHTFFDKGGILRNFDPESTYTAVIDILAETHFEFLYDTFIAGANDPNDKIPGAGYGTEGFVAANAPIPYRINFENDATATAPAQVVTITDQLSANFDWSTFALTEIGWGDTLLTIPTNTRHYQTTVQVTIGGKTFSVLVEAGINTNLGQVYATFQSIDPTTQLPPDVLTGFLPPEDGTGRGMGHLSFTIRAKAGLATGTEIRNVALISFDGQTAISTDQVDPHDPSKGIDPNKQARITIDAVTPTSTVASLPAISTTTGFTVTWSGSDDVGGSGVSGYDVYVSTNNGAYTRWLTNTALTSATYTGAFGNTYRFYSVAIDNSGQRQPAATVAQATTQLIDPRGTSIIVTSNMMTSSVYGQSILFTAMISPLLAGNPVPTGTIQFQVDGVNLGSPVVLNNGTAALTTNTLNAGNRIITARYTSDTGNYDPSTSVAFTQVITRVTLTVRANDVTKVAGDPIPTLTATYTGFVNNETASVLTGSPSLSVPGAAANTAGTYTITASAGTLASANYTFQFVNGTMVVNPAAPATITVLGGSPQTSTVGNPFTTSFRVSVKDAYGNLLSGVPVTFTAPASGASGLFVGNVTNITVTTASNGEATATAFTANYTPGAYTLTASVNSISANFALANTAPAVSSLAVNNGTSQRSRVLTLTVNFDSNVTVAPGAFTISGVSPTGVPLTAVTVAFTTQVVNGRTVATLTLSGTNTDFGSLADGRWTLIIDRNKVTISGVPMAADYSSATAGVSISRLFGDTDGDGDVDAVDNLRFRQAYGSFSGQTAYRAELDFDGDGDIDAIDNLRFRQRYGTILPP